MPFINDYKCNQCDLALKSGWGYHFYVEDNEGKRIVGKHPRERYKVKEVLGKDASLKIIRERTGFNSDCICLDCLYQFKADVGEDGWSPFNREFKNYRPGERQGKDKRECPKCRSMVVKTTREMIKKQCPKCKEGVIEEIWTGSIS